MKFRGIQAISSATVQKLAITREIFIIASMQSIMSAFGFPTSTTIVRGRSRRTKFQSKQSVFSPGHRCIHMNLVLCGTQVRETFSPGRFKIHLNPRIRSNLSHILNRDTRKYRKSLKQLSSLKDIFSRAKMISELLSV